VEVTIDGAIGLSRKVVDELCRRQIILPTPQKHEYLEDGPRYATGPRVGTVADHNDCFPCGMDVVIGRTVYDAGDSGLSSISCPKCGKSCDIESEGWSSAIGAWANRQGAGDLFCTGCQTASPIVYWQFDPTWGFGELGFQFSEWFLREEFVKELSEILGHRVVWVRSHI
jgi:hypothetical protein